MSDDARARLRALAAELPLTNGMLMMSLENVRDGRTPSRVVDATAAIMIINQVDSLVSMITELRGAVKTALSLNDAEIYVPGDWICPTCGFIESRRMLSALDGTVCVNLTSPELPCRNDGTFLERLTWKQHADNLRKMLEPFLLDGPPVRDAPPPDEEGRTNA